MKPAVDRAEQQQLDDWLKELARADLEAGTGPGLEARTLAAWERARAGRTASPSAPSPAKSRGPGRIVAVAGLAATLLLAVALPSMTCDSGPARQRQAAGRPRPDAIDPTPIRPIAASPAGESSERAGSAARSVLGNRPQPLPRRGQRPAAPEPARAVSEPLSVETVTFLPLGPDIERELTGSFQLARVRVSRDVLVDLGLLMDGHRGGDPVQADVVFGEDGLARAIRLTPLARTGRVP